MTGKIASAGSHRHDPGGTKAASRARSAIHRTGHAIVGICLGISLASGLAVANPASWKTEWPRTDFSKHAIDYSEILSGGPPKDGIPSIDKPIFVPADSIDDLAHDEPVISLEVDGVARAYPLRILIWHEIVNDVVGSVPVAVTYCPLCNTGIAFERVIDGQVLDFGTTGKLRHSDLIMYDRQTESWWQQYFGEAIVGVMTGKRLPTLPVRLESFGRFSSRHPTAPVLVPEQAGLRAYGTNPYVGYDTGVPWFYNDTLPEGIEPLARVIVVEDTAWSLDLLRQRGQIVAGDLKLSWEPGQHSALDTRNIVDGRDIGNVVVQRRVDGRDVDAVHAVTFAFVFHAFQPDGTLITR